MIEGVNLFLNIKSGHIMINVQDRDSLIKTIQHQEQTIKKQQDEIRELKNKNRVRICLSLETENLEFAQKLHAANKEIERLQVVEQAYAAYKKSY